MVQLDRVSRLELFSAVGLLAPELDVGMDVASGWNDERKLLDRIFGFFPLFLNRLILSVPVTVNFQDGFEMLEADVAGLLVPVGSFLFGIGDRERTASRVLIRWDLLLLDDDLSAVL